MLYYKQGDKRMTNTLDIIKNILSDDYKIDETAIKDIMNESNMLGSNIVGSNIVANNIIGNKTYQIFSETEAILGVKQDLSKLHDINEVDRIRYIFTSDNPPIYLGKYDGIKDELVVSKKGLEELMPYPHIRKIISKCKKDNGVDIGRYKDIVEMRKTQAMYNKNILPQIDIKDDEMMCVSCKMVYPKNESYFSRVGGVIVGAERVDENPKKKRKKKDEVPIEYVTIQDDDKTYSGEFLNICKKCEMLRVNDEFYKQRLRDRKGAWLKSSTLMSSEDIMNLNIEDIPDIENKALYEKRVMKDKLSLDFGSNMSGSNMSGSNSANISPRIRCVETGKVFGSTKVAEKYLGKEHGAVRINRVLDNPNKIAYGCHWVSIVDD